MALPSTRAGARRRVASDRTPRRVGAEPTRGFREAIIADSEPRVIRPHAQNRTAAAPALPLPRARRPPSCSGGPRDRGRGETPRGGARAHSAGAGEPLPAVPDGAGVAAGRAGEV